jgi:hypothetical protein
MNNSKSVIQKLLNNGWCPVSYKHQPEHIKIAIKAANFRPAAKQCFSNAQKLVLMQHKVKLTYVEGIVSSVIPILHAWVKDEENVYHDITLGKMYPVLYYQEYSKDHIHSNIVKTQMFSPIDENNLSLVQTAIIMGLNPYESKESLKKQIFEKMQKNIDKV